MRKVKEMSITIMDILLMDKGTKAYTEYDFDEDVLTYRMDNPESLEWVMGHIHSHNTMDVFFSGTDMSELNDNCPQHNIYLSLIVNNFMEMTAKLAFIAEMQHFTCKDEEGKDYTLKITGADIKPMMFIYKCDIQVPFNEVLVNDSFKDRLKAVEEKVILKKSIEKENKKPIVLSSDAPYYRDIDPNNKKTTKGFDTFDNWKKGDLAKKAHNGYRETTLKEIEDFERRDFNRHTGSGKFEEPIDEDTDEMTLEDQFACFILRLGNPVEDDTVHDALEDLHVANLSTKAYCQTVIETYAAWYEQFFDGHKGYDTDDDFLETLEQTIMIIDEYDGEFDYIAQLTETLKLYGNRYEQQLKTAI